MYKSLIVFIFALFLINFIQATELTKIQEKLTLKKTEAKTEACTNSFYVANALYGTFLVAGVRKHYDNDDDRTCVLSDTQFDQWKLPDSSSAYLVHQNTGYWFDLASGRQNGDLFIDKTYLAGSYVFQLWTFKLQNDGVSYQIVYNANNNWVVAATGRYTIGMVNSNPTDKAQLWTLSQ